MSAGMPEGVKELVTYLGELGPRWGLPANACRVHGYLYLMARPVPESELDQALSIGQDALSDALAWLVDYRLVSQTPSRSWRTEQDPWDLLVRALDERRERELAPALETLRACHRAASAGTYREQCVRTQIGKLLDLVEDIAALDAQARRLSPTALRQMIGIGGRAARLMGRALGKGGSDGWER